MNITLCAVGRLRSGPELDLFETYIQRLPWKVDVCEIEVKEAVSQKKKNLIECEQLAAKVPQRAKVICLDSRGKVLSSEAVADSMGKWRDSGVRDLCIVIGGADGLDEHLLQRADMVLSFGAVTWPHMLMRVLLAEQLFRWHCILTDHPYHRGH